MVRGLDNKNSFKIINYSFGACKISGGQVTQTEENEWHINIMNPNEDQKTKMDH